MNLTIITVHLNDFEGLRRTAASLRTALQSQALRWIVVDGDSRFQTPGEREFMDEVRQRADVFISEQDQGTYDAMNKGTAQATGEYVLYLNAGDELQVAFDEAQLEKEMRGQRPEMVWGTCHEKFPGAKLVKVKNRNPRLSWYGMPVNHQNVLFRRDVLGNSPYDTKYRICADYDLIGRILKAGGNVHRTQIPIAIFQRGGLNAQNIRQTMDEEAALRTLHFGVPAPVSTAIKYLKLANARLGQIPAFRRLMRRWV